MKNLNKLISFSLVFILCIGCLSDGLFSLRASASKTEWSSYGAWSAWQDAYVSENDYRKVETRQVDDQPIYETRYSYKTVYHYFRYSTKRVADGKGGSDIPTSTYGTNYYTYDFDYELTISGSMGNKARGYKYYYNAATGNTVSGNYITVWKCDPFTTQEVASSWQELTGYTKKTQYRYCTRSKTDSYYITYNANGGSGAPSTQTKTVVTTIDGTTNNNSTLSSTVPTKSYTITYNANGGSVSPASKSVACTFKNWNTNSAGTGTTYSKGANYTSNSDVTLYAQWTNPTAGTLATPTRTGHSFDGWFTSASGGSKLTSSNAISANTTIFAHWTANTYTISYNANGGSGAPGNQTKTYGVNLTLSSTKPTRKGYIFLGWGESSNDDALYKSGGTFTKNETLTLYAIWQAEKYTVSFDANGGTGALETETFEYDKYVTISRTAPTKEYTVTYDGNGGNVAVNTKTVNCLFTGWNSLQDGTGKNYALGSAYTSDTNQTLYAQWQDPAIGDLAYPSRTGYAFAGWYTDRINGSVVTSDTVVSANMTIFARWTAEQYDVLFNPTGGQSEVSGINVVYDQVYGTLPIPKRTGYDFDGWFTEETGGTQIKSDSIVKTTSQQTLYAHWTAKQYTLTFDATGGTCDVVSKNLIHDSKFGELPLPKKSGYKFVGWFSSINDGLLIQPTDTVTTDYGTVYAHWSELETYVVNYDANGGFGAPYAEIKTETQNYILSDLQPGKTITISFDPAGGKCDASSVELACLFTGWNTASDGSGVNYASGSTYSDDHSVIFFAQYDSANMSELPDATLTGYTFKGWYFDDEPLTTSTDLDTDCKYTAKWETNEYGVSFFDGDDELGFSEYKYDKAGRLSYGIMPQKEGYNLVGWSTSKDGTAEYQYDQEILNLSAENEDIINLYAVWHKLLTVDDLSYSFGNNHSAFGYNTNYKIPLSSYRYIFGNNVKAQQLYFNDKSQKNRFWSGNCFGMSTTSSLFNSPSSDVSVSDYNANATVLSSLKVTDSNTEDSTQLLIFLEGMQLSQKCTLIQKDYLNNKDKLNEICETVETAKYIDELPVIALFGSGGGHAVVGYAIEKISDTESHLHIYDCNFPMINRYITLSTDSDGRYTGWYYKINDRYDWGTEYEGSWISYVPFSHIDHIWENRGDISKMENFNTNILSVNSANFIVKNSRGDIVGQTVDGKFTSFSSDVFEMMYTEIGTDEFLGLDIMLPADQYTFVNLDDAVENLELSIVDTNLGATIASNAREITFNVEDVKDTNTVSVQTNDGDMFNITLKSSADNGYDEVVLTGISDGSEIILSEQNGNLSVQTNNSTQVSLTVDGRTVTTENENEANCVCGKYHSGPFAGLLKFLHKIVYFFKNLFKVS